jgi:hypothetical protein
LRSKPGEGGWPVDVNPTQEGEVRGLICCAVRGVGLSQLHRPFGGFQRLVARPGRRQRRGSRIAEAVLHRGDLIDPPGALVRRQEIRFAKKLGVGKRRRRQFPF